MSLVNLISIDDFYNPFLLVSSNDATEQRINEIITEVQENTLRQILGDELYYQLETDNAGQFPTTQKWVEFINGVVYVKDAKNINYKGIKDVLVKLTFYYFYYYTFTLAAENARVQIEQTTGQQITDKLLIVKAYNLASKQIGNHDDYEYKSSVYNFLNDNYDFADNLIFTQFRTINIFDI